MAYITITDHCGITNRLRLRKVAKIRSGDFEGGTLYAATVVGDDDLHLALILKDGWAWTPMDWAEHVVGVGGIAGVDWHSAEDVSV